MPDEQPRDWYVWREADSDHTPGVRVQDDGAASELAHRLRERAGR
jgi:hypothetical protein